MSGWYICKVEKIEREEEKKEKKKEKRNKLGIDTSHCPLPTARVEYTL